VETKSTLHSVGPYRVTLAEYLRIPANRGLGAAWRIYNEAIDIGFSLFVIFCAWLTMFGAYRLWAGFYPRLDNLVIIVIAFAIGISLVRVSGRWADRRQFHWQAASRGDYVVHLQEEGIRFALGELTTIAPWTAIHRVVETNECLFFFLDSISAIIVPRRVFASSGHADAFFAYAKQRYDAARRA
jgi:hypothetical protein